MNRFFRGLARRSKGPTAPALTAAVLARPCMNPASILFPERDEPMADATELRTIPYHNMTPRKKEEPVTILNRDWRPTFLGWGADDGDDE